MGCRCGCVLHIGRAKPHRLVAASAHACPGRTFWLIKSEEGSRIRVSVEQLWLPCTGQALKVRDGDSSRAELLAVLEGDPQEAPVVTSTSNTLLVEFTAGEPLAHGLDCNGGFLAHVLCVTGQGASNVTPPSVERVLVGPKDRDVILWPGGGYVNAGVALLLLLAVVATGCLCLQYVYRYRKYQLAAAHEELDSITENSLVGGSLGIVRSRATSSSSLISEVISLKKFHVHRANKHCRLAEEEEEDLDMEEYKKIERDATSLTTLKVDDNEEGLNQLSIDKPHIRKAVIVQADVETRPNSLDVERTKRIHQVKLIQKPRFKSPVSPASLSVEEVNITPTNSPRVKRCRASTSSSQSSTLTNGSSPASSRSTTLKETKEKRNRERMMAGSEFSLAEDLEIDYYDYDVENAEPGSYLSMDPAFCLWIPPFAPGLWPEDQVKSPNQETAKSPCVESGKRTFTPPEKETSVEKSPSDYYDLQAELRFADEDEPEDTDLKSKKEQTSKKETCVVVTDIPSKKIYYLPNRRNSSNNSSVIMTDE